MRFVATTVLLFAIGVAGLLAVSYRLATQYRPTARTFSPIDVRAPGPGKLSTPSGGKTSPGPTGRWMVLSALLLACVVLQAVALVLARIDRAPWLQLGVTGAALGIWVMTWWQDRLTLAAIAALSLAPVVGWQAATAWQRRKKTRLAASMPHRNEA
jgi:hypothetical protein